MTAATRFTSALRARLAIAPYMDEPVPVHVGSCIATGARFRRLAHAHCTNGDPYLGWICVLSAKRTAERDLMLHELAHIIQPGGHTDPWRWVLLTIGGTLGEHSGGDIHKRTRKPSRYRGMFNAHSAACPCVLIRADA